MEKYATPELHLNLIKDILYFITDLLDKHNIKYFIDGGTLLGAIRNKDIIKHDDDADIGILYKDFFCKLPSIYNEIKNHKLIINDVDYYLNIDNKYPTLTKIYIQGLWSKTDYGKIIATPTIDIFCWQSKNDIIELYCPKQRKQFKNCYYKKSEMLPLTKWEFGNKNLYGANNPLGYLFRYYGNDCLKVIKIDMRLEENCLNKISESIN